MPAPISPESRSARARLAYSTRQHGTTAEPTTGARRDYAAARLADYIRDTLEKAPPLTDEQRAKLAELLRPVRRPRGRSAVVADRLAELDGGSAA